MLISFPIGLLKLASCIIRNEMHTKNAHKKLGGAIKAAGKWAAEKAGEQADPTVSLDTAGRKRGEMAYGAEGEQVQFAIERDQNGDRYVRIEEDILKAYRRIGQRP